MKHKKLALRLCLSISSILVCLASFEIALRSYRRLFRSPPLHIVIDSPILYGLNPEHSEINSQGLRDDEVLIPKPEGTLRILVLGDSVVYGQDVSRNKTFANHLESLLRKQFGTAEVINAGVSGYSAYNELQYYLTKGREFEPDIVIVAFCMNDVVNPMLHWGYTKEKIVNIPVQAIPNHDYHIRKVLPIIQRRRSYIERKKTLWDNSALYNALKWRVLHLFKRKTGDNRIPKISKPIPEEEKIPTLLSGESKLSIEVLLDETSSEWRWLTSIYSQLHAAVRADQATLIVALFPLAYQLDEHYPFLPQNQIGEYCKQNSILYIDLLELFRQHPKESIFLLRNSSYPRSNDIWHLTEYGHELCAEEILHFLQGEKLLMIEN